jgi:hypothetical protein
MVSSIQVLWNFVPVMYATFPDDLIHALVKVTQLNGWFLGYLMTIDQLRWLCSVESEEKIIMQPEFKK